MGRERQVQNTSPHVRLLLPLFKAPAGETDQSSVWRPLVDVVETDPLVCCDTRTVSDSDLDVVQKVMDDTVEESMYLKRRAAHQWYWMSNQTRDDVLVMTVWDSKRPFRKSSKCIHHHWSNIDSPFCWSRCKN